MAGSKVAFTVFTKPWKMPLPELGAFVGGLGFEGVELPVRPGYQVPPEDVEKGLPEAVRVLADFGVRIGSIAGPADERTIAACAEAGVPIIRILVEVGPDGYLAAEDACRKQLDSLMPGLEKHGVAIGIQNHSGKFVGSAAAVLRLIEGYDPRYVCAVWDQAHCAVAGEPPDLAADILWPHLRLVNLKNVIWRRTNGPEAQVAAWERCWVGGRQGIASWRAVAEELQKRGYVGEICLSAAYSDGDAVDRLIAEDIAFAKSLFAGYSYVP